jgi:hypothetical protein
LAGHVNSEQAAEPEDEPTTGTDPSGVGRRGLVSSLAFGGLALGAGAAGAWVVNRNDTVAFRRRSLTLDMACIGTLWRDAEPRTSAGEKDYRAPFSVEGWLYPGGTIKGDNFVATKDGTVGRWFCRGWVVIDGDREEPHIISHQEFILGTITKQQLFPPDSLTTSGLEGGCGKEQVAHRAVVGGTGEYLGAMGQVTQQFIATNTTPFGLDDPEPSSPCFRFVFDVRVLA